MSFGATKLLAASGGKAYEIDQSLMFDRGDGAYLLRDDGVIADGNKRTFTFATWFKKVQNSANDIIFNVRNGGGNELFMIYIPTNEQTMWIFQKRASDGNVIWYLEPTQKIRDVGAWYHFVIAVDTTQSTAANRVKLYINGTQVTSFTGSSSYPDQNLDTPCNNDSFDHQIGYNGAASLDGYMAETYLIDGTAQAASAFGETDAVTGAWIPKKYTGSYGNNGFYLKYVSGAIGTDSSGNGNNYTATNLANADVVLDTPTNNYPIINSVLPLDTTLVKLYQGNLRTYGGAQSGGNGQANSYCTFQMPSSGKWYIESYVGIGQGSAGGNNGAIGVIESTFVLPNTDAIMFSQAGFTGLVFDTYTNTAKLYDGGSAVDTDTGLTGTVYVVALAIDVDNGKVYGGYGTTSITWMNSGDPAGDSNGMAHTFSSDTVIGVYLTVDGSSPANTADLRLNFGQNGTFNGGKTAGGNTDSAGEGNFFYSVPSGFKALCTKNLSTPAVKKSTDYFNTILYTGNDTEDRAITGVGFAPDLVWIKSRSTTYYHQLHDKVRGTSGGALYSNVTNAEAPTKSLASFDSDGFTVMKDADNDAQNDTGETYVAWNWKAGGASPSKTYAVKVVSDSGNKYRFDDYGTSAVTLNLQEGGTYTFDQSDSSNATHPLRFSTTSDGGHGGGSEYTTGVTTNGTPGSSGAYTRITVAASAPTLYYYCTAHSGMGGQVNTNTTSGATNLDGSILSVVSENTTSGFGIASYTGTGANATVGHELGVAPSLIIVKNRAAADNWAVYSRGDATDYLVFNDADGSTDDNTYWNDTAPTSSVFSIGTAHNVNASSETYVAYCFAEVEGFSKFGTYEANNSTNGPFIYTGFTPSWIVFKYIDGAGEWWWMLDSTRDPTNLTTEILYINSNTAEGTISGSAGVDFLSNGFKIRATNGGINSANTYFYMAFAEFPFKSANAR